MDYNLAFSSSGILIGAHIGVLAYLQDRDIKIKNYSGTSGGAVVATWAANNLDARDLLRLIVQFGYIEYFVRPSLSIGGFFDSSNFGKIISSYCKPKKNLWVVTFNVLKMQKEIWNGENFNLSKILTATTCIPGLFKPVIYSNGLHIDGIFGKYCPDDLWNFGTTISAQIQSNKKKYSRYAFDDFVNKIENVSLSFLKKRQNNLLKTNLVDLSINVSSLSQLDLFAVKAEDHIELFKIGYNCADQVFSNLSNEVAVGAGCNQSYS